MGTIVHSPEGRFCQITRHMSAPDVDVVIATGVPIETMLLPFGARELFGGVNFGAWTELRSAGALGACAARPNTGNIRKTHINIMIRYAETDCRK